MSNQEKLQKLSQIVVSMAGSMGHVTKKNLTDKQAAFVTEYLRNGFNGTRAAITAGYSEASAHAIACELLRNPKVAQEVRERLDTEGITAERVKVAIAEIAFDGDMAEFEGWLGGGQTLAQLADKGLNTKLVKSAQVIDTKDGENRKIEMYDRLAALRELTRVLGIVTERREVSGQIQHLHEVTLSDERLQEAVKAWRERLAAEVEPERPQSGS